MLCAELFIQEFLSVHGENKESTSETKPQIHKYYGNKQIHGHYIHLEVCG